MHATEIRCFRKLLSISYKDHIFGINEEVRNRIRQAIGTYDDILSNEQLIKSGLGIYQDQKGLPRQSYKEKCREEEENDKECAGKITSLTGHEGLRFCESLREFKNTIIRKRLENSWCPNGDHGYGIGAGVG